ncbi:MAG: hypothetical protein A3G02_03255 [Candidatus Yanofskybacteria bacterium RIFCSPLOWO2_12_FULL_44_13b]|uniref:Uncharacterized protein n=2 Tax=Candidatus Yanofskyibacteriota TaxID=1752733 RepID=A0A1F8H0N3_9BACT|nr:MAG: hypothetical protein UW14_C0010G0007 [Candidatus Yanofskybacteria bacterium GW2011_GWA2_44_10]KKT90150.1 MAG: hypothetical protein UW90_C0005G0005 [Candidatus Yanofskybacteria bacterium GW2011_GWB1_45_11]OGN15019.1 MAG: hypothetical protein A3C01_02820 [Candidatus Yanofskybacteria bacterium RIFCSPHIGHO2_02_FULL_44_36b]OGN18950.1 MAG: hypothetical protein A3F50_01305 [Candidatus Yanofskybacteria bacterium RIFCSPHIGHO2_12_FULL_44_29b]OGN25677.1 MAG: hypothetical protein A3B12_00460 [Candi
MKFTSIILIISLLGISLPVESSAAVANYLIGGSSCVAGGVASAKFQSYVDGGVNWLETKGINFIKNGVIGLFKKPVLASKPITDKLGGLVGIGAVPVSDKQTQEEVRSILKNSKDKEAVRDVIARCVAREVLNAAVSGILNLARTAGRDGGPTYVKNWRTFQANALYRGEDFFRAQLSNSNLCNYIDKEVKKTFGVKKKTSVPSNNARYGSLDSLSGKTNCTMPNNFSYEDYQKNFGENGGWEAFNRLLEPQNNYYGVLFQSLDELEAQKSAELSADINEAVSGKGFTSKRGNNATESCISKGVNGRCIAYKDIKTPGSIIEANVSAALQSEFNWISSATQLGSIIEVGTNLLLRRLSDLGDSTESHEFYSGNLPDLPDPSSFPSEDSGGIGSGDNRDQCILGCSNLIDSADAFRACIAQCDGGLGGSDNTPGDGDVIRQSQ